MTNSLIYSMVSMKKILQIRKCIKDLFYLWNYYLNLQRYNCQKIISKVTYSIES
jgi:hypothetical protein